MSLDIIGGTFPLFDPKLPLAFLNPWSIEGVIFYEVEFHF